MFFFFSSIVSITICHRSLIVLPIVLAWLRVFWLRSESAQNTTKNLTSVCLW